MTWDQNLEAHGAAAFHEHAALVDELLERIRRDGPLSATDVEPRAAIDWYWRPTNQVRAILEALAEAGILGLARRDGNRRIYDLAERLFPAELLDIRPPEREQRRHKLLSRYRAHGLLGRSGSAELWYGIAPVKRVDEAKGGPARAELLSELVEAGRLVPVAVDGVRGERYVLADEVDLLAKPPEAVEPGVALLAPLDPLVWDRDFLRALYDFDYVWEVYVPAAKRTLGVLRPADPLRRSAGRPDRAADRSSGRHAARRRLVVGARFRTLASGWVRRGALEGARRPRRAQRGEPDRASAEWPRAIARDGDPRAAGTWRAPWRQRPGRGAQTLTVTSTQSPRLPTRSRARIRYS